jgi:hypothetical protein
VRKFGVCGWTAYWACNQAVVQRNPMSQCRIDEATEILVMLQDDIVSLWEDPDVCDLLQVKGICIEDRPGLCIVHLSHATKTSPYIFAQLPL